MTAPIDASVELHRTNTHRTQIWQPLEKKDSQVETKRYSVDLPLGGPAHSHLLGLSMYGEVLTTVPTYCLYLAVNSYRQTLKNLGVCGIRCGFFCISYARYEISLFYVCLVYNEKQIITELGYRYRYLYSNSDTITTKLKLCNKLCHCIRTTEPLTL